MILRSCCNTCFGRFDVTVTVDKRELLAGLADVDGTAACPRGCGGRVNLKNDPSIDTIAGALKEPVRLSAEEFYRAVHGMGLPDEVPNSPELVESLLRSSSITKVQLEEVGGRVYLHELHLDNGTVIHLTAGGRGAQVLKVTRAR